MKKIFALTLAVSMMANAFAQVAVTKMDKSEMKKDVQLTFKSQNINRPMDLTASYENGHIPASSAARIQKAAEAVVDTVYYLADPSYAYYTGFDNNGMGYVPFLFQPVETDMTFYNIGTLAEDTKVAWTLDGKSEVSQEKNLTIPAGEIFEDYGMAGQGIMPILMTSTGGYYFYGISQEATGKYFWGSYPDFFMPLTKCHMYTSLTFQAKGRDYVMMSYDETRPHVFGSGFDLTKEGLGLIDSIGTVFGQEGTITTVDSINLLVWSAGSSLQIGNSLKMTLYPVTVDGQKALIETSKPIASHVATDKDITYSSTQNNTTMGIVAFPIKEVIEGKFFIEITGMNGKGADFGIFSDGMDRMGFGDTYMIYGGKYNNFFGLNITMSVIATICDHAVEPEGLRNTAAAAKAVKSIRNGQMLIEKAGKTYNAFGQEIK